MMNRMEQDMRIHVLIDRLLEKRVSREKSLKMDVISSYYPAQVKL